MYSLGIVLQQMTRPLREMVELEVLLLAAVRGLAGCTVTARLFHKIVFWI